MKSSLGITTDVPKLERMLRAPARRYSIDEALDLMGRVYATIESVEDFRLKLKWCLGHLVVHLDCPKRGRTATMEQLSERLWKDREIRVNVSSLFECAAVVRSFEGNFLKFETWVRDTKALFGRPIYWSDVQRMILGGRSNPKVIGPEAADERDIRTIEEGTDAIDRLLSRKHSGDAVDVTEGVVEGFRQSAEALLNTADAEAPIPRSDEYRAFVRRFGCTVCGHPADAHHAFGKGGTSVKSSDFTCIPLCRNHHMKWHQLGADRFEEQYDVDAIEIAFNLLHRFVTGTWATTVLSEP